MSEGSVIVEGVDSYSSQEGSTEQTEETTEAVSQEAQAEETTQEPQGEGVELTEKGTKKDPNPMSAVHQELANERRMRLQFEQVLGDPEKLKAYMKQAGWDKQEAQQVAQAEEDLFKPDQFQTEADFADALNKVVKMVSSKDKELSDLRQNINGLSSATKQTQIVRQLESDVASLRGEYKELDPTSSEFDPELDKTIAEAFAEVDLDDKGRSTGKISLLKFAKRYVDIARKGKNSGKTEAQTTVKQKTLGKITSGGKVATETKDDDNLSIGDSIAARISKLV